MKTNKLAFAAAALVAVAANADVNVQLFTPSTSTSYVFTEDALIDGYSKTYTLGASYNYLNRPLVELTNDRRERLNDLVTAINTLDIFGGYFLADNLFIGADLPLNMVALPSKASEFALGDARVFAKIRLTSLTAPVGIALMPEAWIPTGESQYFLTDGKIGAGARAIAEREFGVLRASATVGYRYTSDGQFRDVRYRNRLSAGLGGAIRLAPKWAFNAEGTGTLVLPKNPEQNPGEAYVGLQYRPSKEVTIAGGGALGAVNGIGSSDYRIVAGVKFMPLPAPAPVVQAAPAPIVVSAVVKKPQPRVFFEKKEIRVTEEIQFEHAKANLTESGKRLMDEVAAVIKANLDNFKTLTIEGHTNQLGTHQYNNKLSRERAAAVQAYLVSKGISADRLESIGYGKTRPNSATGLTQKEHLIVDRRVEFKVNNYTTAELSAMQKRAQTAAEAAANKAVADVQKDIDAQLDAGTKPTDTK